MFGSYPRRQLCTLSHRATPLFRASTSSLGVRAPGCIKSRYFSDGTSESSQTPKSSYSSSRIVFVTLLGGAIAGGYIYRDEVIDNFSEQFPVLKTLRKKSSSLNKLPSYNQIPTPSPPGTKKETKEQKEQQKTTPKAKKSTASNVDVSQKFKKDLKKRQIAMDDKRVPTKEKPKPKPKAEERVIAIAKSAPKTEPPKTPREPTTTPAPKPKKAAPQASVSPADKYQQRVDLMRQYSPEKAIHVTREVTQYEQAVAEINALQQELEQLAFQKIVSDHEIEELNRRLTEVAMELNESLKSLEEKDTFIQEKVKALEDGKKAYEETINIYNEMKVELEESMMNTVEHMERERQKRMERLDEFSKDIRALESILEWNENNHEFFLKLGELNAVVKTLETRVNNGVSFNNEIQYLLNKLPESFVSRNMLGDLAQLSQEDNFVMPTHTELYDRFCVLEKTLRETAMVPRRSGSLWGNLLARIFAIPLAREQIQRTGVDPQARISRAGYAMQQGDLDSALAELKQLDETILYPGENWLQCARSRMFALTAIDLVRTELLGRSVKAFESNNSIDA